MAQSDRTDRTSGPQQPHGVVLVTGASGFIGSAVIARLAGAYEIVGLDRAGPPAPPEPAIAVDIDLSSDASVHAALEQVRARFGGRIASVVHLAAYYDVSGEPNPLYDEITVAGTGRLIDALQSFEVEQFIYASTMLVHRPTGRPEARIDEDSPLDPRWPYPQSKAKAEALLHARRGKVPVVFLRIAGVYEDEGRAPFLAEQIARIYEHRLTSHFYPGMLCAAQSFLHRDDLTDAISRLVERRKALPSELPLLLGEPEAPGYAEIQDIVGRQLHGEDWATLRIPQPLAKAGVMLQDQALGSESFIRPWMIEASNDHYILDISRAKALLDWAPAHRLRATLPDMIEALKRDPQGWYKANKLNANLVAWYKKPVSHDGHSEGAGKTAPGASPTAHGADGPDPHDGHMAMMARDERRSRWAHFANIGLGLWLASSPFIYDAFSTQDVAETVRAVTIERGLAPIEWRADMLAMSDMVSGLALALLGAASLSKRTRWWGQWGAAFVGIWLLFAPLLLWSPSAAQYNTDLIVGALAIAFAVVVPMMPGMSMAGMMDPKTIPPGWTYSPSTDAQRLPIVAMGLVGLVISRYLTAYQLGHIDGVWEPFFAGAAADPRNGTEEIITSSVSQAWPIPDAGLGAISYLLEILMAVMGTRDRWRTMPWMVTFFGILVIPLGVISIYFIIIQPIMIGTWSTLALIAALAMLIMVPFAIDEVIAMGQFLYWARCRGKPLVRTFFKGDAVEAGAPDDTDMMASPAIWWADAIRGMTLPRTLFLTILIGLFLMLTRPIFGTTGAMANSDHVVGALLVTVSIIATCEAVRALRFVNTLLGFWLIAAPFWLDGGGTTATIACEILGLLVIWLSPPRGNRSREHYAGWDRFVI
ncbi:NAD-dependent epimerase/dehydratase family protein [Sphingosinicella sp. LHD-64]|uniref:NAD-dependent epimerase/dehydratase family protein n=1 Tax=Sphingosinicella sp. LHD-64 TaxID=3072139 RepID=UPI0028105028|nr:NAD-dependent epimerase/dehydratase family protein [Sphingosinicella sp. LHD-64]MDQ8757402.1 NAD-dependent epimerase/dehydratase family protein [Sphingosinicella sp. LHD-64]